MKCGCGCGLIRSCLEINNFYWLSCDFVLRAWVTWQNWNPKVALISRNYNGIVTVILVSITFILAIFLPMAFFNFVVLLQSNTVSVTSILGGTSDNTGSSMARRLGAYHTSFLILFWLNSWCFLLRFYILILIICILLFSVLRTGLNIVIACNIPKDSPMLEVTSTFKRVKIIFLWALAILNLGLWGNSDISWWLNCKFWHNLLNLIRMDFVYVTAEILSFMVLCTKGKSCFEFSTSAFGLMSPLNSFFGLAPGTLLLLSLESFCLFAPYFIDTALSLSDMTPLIKTILDDA